MVLKCPQCKSENITLYMGFQFGKYQCKDCDYIGSLIIEEVSKKMAKRKVKKKPWIVAVLNFLFYGAGYLYAGKKKALGWGLIVVFVVMTIEFFLGTVNHLQDPVSTHIISTTLLSFILAYDGYIVTQEG